MAKTRESYLPLNWERLGSSRDLSAKLNGVHVRGKARIGLRTNLALIALLGMAYGQLKMNAKAWGSITRVAR